MSTGEERQDDRLEKLEDELEKVRIELARYKGFVGGIVAVLTAVATFFEFLWDPIKAYFHH